jgi:predicted lipoprotein with Yx(FWY)xxD motif
MLLAAFAGVATAAVVGAALARTFTLHGITNAKVVNQMGVTTSGNIVVNAHGFAIYDLTGDSKRHPECTKANGCFRFWPPITVSSPTKLSKGPGVTGRLGVWRRNGFFQVTLGGRPVYGFANDSRGHMATGEGIHGFGGTWHAIRAAGSTNGTTTTATTTGTASGTTSTASGTTSTASGTTSTASGTTTMETTSTTATSSTTVTMPCLYPPCY